MLKLLGAIEIIVVFATTFMSGCASSQTIHEYCSDLNNIGRYSTYDSCVSEKKEERAAKVAKHGKPSGFGRAMGAFSQGFRNAQANNISCTSSTSFGTTTTNCN